MPTLSDIDTISFSCSLLSLGLPRRNQREVCPRAKGHGTIEPGGRETGHEAIFNEYPDSSAGVMRKRNFARHCLGCNPLVSHCRLTRRIAETAEPHCCMFIVGVVHPGPSTENTLPALGPLGFCRPCSAGSVSSTMGNEQIMRVQNSTNSDKTRVRELFLSS